MAHYDDVVFPVNPHFGSGMGPSTAVDVVFTGGGYRHANSRWSQKLRKFSIELSAKAIADIYAVRELFEAMDGPLNSFLIRDWSDWNTTAGRMGSDGASYITATDQVLRNTATSLYVGDGSTRTFQMVKVYTRGTATHYRTITKPQSGTVSVSVDAVTKSEGSPTDYSINYATGIVTFQTAPGAGVSPTGVPVKWGGAFYVPVAFVDNDFETILRTLKTDSVASVELIEVRGV